MKFIITDDPHEELIRRIEKHGSAILYIDGDPFTMVLVNGILRFEANPIVRCLIDWSTAHGYSLNEIVPQFWDKLRDLRRLYAMIGYSLSGFLELKANSEETTGMTMALPASAELPARPETID